MDQLEGQRCELGPGCEGIYVEPARDWINAELDPEDALMRVTAGQSELLKNDIYLSGDVVLTRGNASARAEQAHLDRNTNILTLDGAVEMRQPGMLIRSQHAVINADTQMGQFMDARYLDYGNGSRTTAVLANRISEYQLDLETATYTTCTPDNEVWSLKASHMHLDYETGQGTAKHARFNIQDVPVFYTPWLRFPLDDRRMSGFLWPTMGSSSQSGLDIAVPYYFNIAPNFDMTLAPHYYADRGTMTEGEVRYLNQYGWLTLSGAYLGEDNQTEEDRWLEDVKHAGRYGQYWSSYAKYTEVSDNDYFDDFELASLEVKRATHLEQKAGFVYASPKWRAEIEVADYQTIDRLVADPYRRLPQITLQNNAISDNFSPDLIFLTQLTSFDNKDSLIEGGRFVTGERAFVEGGVSFPMNWSAGFIIPTAKLRHLSYDLDTVDATQDSPSTTVPLGTLDMGLFFEREMRLGETAYTQTLEPRLYYFYSQYENQDDNPDFDTNRLTFTYNQLFRDTRFAGYDRLDDAKQLSVGVSSHFLREKDGREILGMSIGQIYYFEDRDIQLNNNFPETTDTDSSSEIAGELMFQPVDNLWLSSTAIWDSRESTMSEGGASFHYVSSSRAVYNLSYRYDRDAVFAPDENDLQRDLEQINASVALPVSKRWELFGSYQYDLSGDYSIENMVGLQYDGCCWLVRFAYQRALTSEKFEDGELKQDRDNTFLLEFQLKGLGSVGNRVLDLLQESILGYEEK